MKKFLAGPGSERGIVLPAALIAMGLTALIVSSFLNLADSSLKIRAAHELKTDRHYAAEAGVEWALWGLETGDLQPPLPDDPPLVVDAPSINNCSVTVEITPRQVYENLLMIMYEVVATATNGDGKATTVRSSQWDDIALVDYDMFQYAVVSLDGNIVTTGGATNDPMVTSTPSGGDGNVRACGGNVSLDNGWVDGNAIATGTIDDLYVGGVSSPGAEQIMLKEWQINKMASYYSDPTTWDPDAHGGVEADSRWFVPHAVSASPAATIDDLEDIALPGSWDDVTSLWCWDTQFPDDTYLKINSAILTAPCFGAGQWWFGGAVKTKKDLSFWAGTAPTFEGPLYVKQDLAISGGADATFEAPVQIDKALSILLGGSDVYFEDDLQVSTDSHFDAGVDVYLSGTTTFDRDLTLNIGATLHMQPGSALKVGGDLTIWGGASIVYEGTPGVDEPAIVEVGDNLVFQSGASAEFGGSLKVGRNVTTPDINLLPITAEFYGPVEIGGYLKAPWVGVTMDFHEDLTVDGQWHTGGHSIYMVDTEADFRGPVLVNDGQVNFGVSDFGPGFEFHDGAPLKILGNNDLVIQAWDWGVFPGPDEPFIFDMIDVGGDVVFINALGTSGMEFNNPIRVEGTIRLQSWDGFLGETAINFNDIVNVYGGIDMASDWDVPLAATLTLSFNGNVVFFGSDEVEFNSRLKSDPDYIPVIISTEGDITFRDAFLIPDEPLSAVVYAPEGTITLENWWYDKTIKGCLVGKDVTIRANAISGAVNTVEYPEDGVRTTPTQERGLPATYD